MLTIQRVKIDGLLPNSENPRSHPEANIAAIRASLERFGQAEPLIIQSRSGKVVGGNGRLLAMKQMGWTECDIVEMDIDDQTATALGIALNRASDLATWDNQSLLSILETLKADGAMAGVGFSETDMQALLAEIEASLPPKELEDEGPGEPPATPVSRMGDLWILGQHKLLCGDSTDINDVRRVMNGELADLVATDSPYLVDYTGERPNDSGKDWTAVYKEVEIKDADKFFRSTCTNILEVLAPHAAIYFWHAHKRCGLIQRVWEDLGILDHQQIIWVKPAAVFGRVFWHFRHEPCMMGWRQGSQPTHDGDQTINSVWEVDWEGKARLQSDHPTSKPVQSSPARCVSTRSPAIFVTNHFRDRGPQIISAERERRKCYAIEISAPFVDVAVERWQKATNQTATLDGDGRTFEQLKAERVGV